MLCAFRHTHKNKKENSNSREQNYQVCFFFGIIYHFLSLVFSKASKNVSSCLTLIFYHNQSKSRLRGDNIDAITDNYFCIRY